MGYSGEVISNATRKAVANLPSMVERDGHGDHSRYGLGYVA